MSGGRLWTEDEERLLADNIALDNFELGKLLGRTEQAIIGRLSVLGIIRPRARNYTVEKNRCRNITRNAVLDRRLKKQPCIVCGTTLEVQAHHDSYSRPLEIDWLCIQHHMKLHTMFRKALSDLRHENRQFTFVDERGINEQVSICQ